MAWDLEAEAESESVSKRGTFRRGDADPVSFRYVSETVCFNSVKPLEVCGRVKITDMLVMLMRSEAGYRHSLDLMAGRLDVSVYLAVLCSILKHGSGHS